MEVTNVTKHIKDEDGPSIFKRSAFWFCVLASVVGWAAIIGLLLIFRESLPF
tara:strand:- start:364 stop:519 length:156 start_codon:yes stop_codon:yes gene_type:complete